MILSPKGFCLIKHDLVIAVGTCGKMTEKIKVRGRTGTDGWTDALEESIWKLCERGGRSVIDDEFFSELDNYQRDSEEWGFARPGSCCGLPMSKMSKEKRGRRIQEIGVSIERKLHPHSIFNFAEEMPPCASACCWRVCQRRATGVAFVQACTCFVVSLQPFSGICVGNVADACGRATVLLALLP